MFIGKLKLQLDSLCQDPLSPRRLVGSLSKAFTTIYKVRGCVCGIYSIMATDVAFDTSMV